MSTPEQLVATPAPSHERPTFRSSAVARLAGMPVSTLRIWEQRYQAVAPATAPTGQRQYSADDVERVVLLRQLTRQGHAIGSLAALAIGPLRQLASTHAAAAAPPGTPANAARGAAALRIVVIGRAMAQRLQRPSTVGCWPKAPEVVAVFDSLTDATQAGVPAGTAPIDVLLWQAPGLQSDAWPELKAAQGVWRARQLAVAYRFAGAAARDSLIRNGASVVREPADDAALVAWLKSLAPVAEIKGREHAPPPLAHGTDPWSLDGFGLAEGSAPARRFDDATLTAFAGLTSSVACECPGHVAELLMQIASFERYSAGCASRSPADAELHAYLQRVAGAARHVFETALERVAAAEGLALP